VFEPTRRQNWARITSSMADILKNPHEEEVVDAEMRRLRRQRLEICDTGNSVRGTHCPEGRWLAN